MICLDNTDTIEAWSATDAVVDYTIHGLVGTTFTQLAAGVLGNVADLVIYTAPAATSIVSIIFVNTDASAATVNCRLDPADGGTNERYLIPKAVSLGPGYSLHTDGARISIINPTGAIVYTYLAHTHDGDTLLLDGINSNGGAFPFTTSGPITLTQNLIIPDAGNIGSVSDTDAIAISNDGTLAFSGQSGFSASLSGHQDVGNNAVVLVEFDTEEDDVQNEFNVATHTFTAKEDGIRLASIVVYYNETIADGSYMKVLLYKNGASYTQAELTLGAVRAPGISLSCRLPLVATDTIDARTKHTHTEAREISSTVCRFSIAKIA